MNEDLLSWPDQFFAKKWAHYRYVYSNKIVIVTGGFDPLHSGHIEYFNAAKALGDKLVVGLNSDAWLTRKRGLPFMPLLERYKIIKALKIVDYVIEFNDDDNSARNAIKIVREAFPNAKLIFANGGDRNINNTVEQDIQDDNLKFVFDVGGNHKINSSSWILNNYAQNILHKSERSLKEEQLLAKSYENKIKQWGYYRVLYEMPTLKVKKLVVNPGASLSMQKHNYRNEYWHVISGRGVMYEEIPKDIKSYFDGAPYGVCTDDQDDEDRIIKKELYKNSYINIPIGSWHKLSNPFDELLHIIEIQWGLKCIEEDIERKNF